MTPVNLVDMVMWPQLIEDGDAELELLWLNVLSFLETN